MPGLSPLLDDNDHRSQKQNQDDQAADAGPEDQPHVLGMLGDLQRSFGVLTGGWKRPESSGYPDVLSLKARFLLRQQLIITAFNAASGQGKQTTTIAGIIGRRRRTAGPENQRDFPI